MGGFELYLGDQFQKSYRPLEEDIVCLLPSTTESVVPAEAPQSENTR